MELSLAISPCPNDTFAFYAMVHNLVDTEGLSFKLSFADIEELNNSALCGKYDISKLSYNGYFSVVERYVMLKSGSALGFNNGPLLVTKKGNIFNPNKKIAIPGVHTTAALLLKTAYPEACNRVPMLFSDIEGAILKGEVDAGVLIHEGRFTYKSKGLDLVMDLGEYWQSNFNYPIPLGGIAIKRELSKELGEKVNRVLKRSIEFAFANAELTDEFVNSHAQELSKEIQQKHINLFVNENTLNISKLGVEAVQFLYNKYLDEQPNNVVLFID